MELQSPENQSEKFINRMNFLMNDVLKITSYRIRKDLGISLSGVYGIMNGKVKPGMDFIARFCTFYGVSANYFILGIEPVLLSDVEITKQMVVYKVNNEIDDVINKLEDFKIKYGK